MIFRMICFRIYLLMLTFCFRLVVCPNPNTADINPPESQSRGGSQQSPRNPLAVVQKPPEKSRGSAGPVVVRANGRTVANANARPNPNGLALQVANNGTNVVQNGNKGLINANTTTKPSSNGVTLDFTAQKVDDRLETSDSVPETLRYSPKANAKITQLAGHGYTCNTDPSKVVDNVFCKSTFDGNITVNYTDGTYDQYLLTSGSGFEKVKDVNQTTQENSPLVEDEQTGAIQSNGQASALSVKSSHVDPSPVKTDQTDGQSVSVTEQEQKKYSVTLSVESGTDNKGIKQINSGKINCYRAEDYDSMIDKIKVRNKERDLGNKCVDCIVCAIKENDEIAILVAQKQDDGEWRSYTLSQKPNTDIRRDVTLKSKFTSINVENLFSTQESEDDDDENVLEYKISYNGSNATFEYVSAKEYTLKTTDNSGGKGTEVIKFEEPFKVPQDMELISIRSISTGDNTQHIYGFRSGPILLNEKYSISRGRDQGSFKKHYYGYNDFSIKPSCEHFGTDVNKRPHVLFLDTITINASNVGLDVVHYNAFQVINVEKRDVSTLVVLPNIEIFLDATVAHNLVVCNSGNDVNLALTTLVDGQSRHYLISNEASAQKYFSIKKCSQSGTNPHV